MEDTMKPRIVALVFALLAAGCATEAEIRARLAPLFTNLGDQSLFGFGAMCPNHDGAHCPEKALRYAHLTARQF